MESVWQNVHAKFMDQLLNRRVDEMLESEDWLRSMRYNHKEVKWWQKRAGHIFEERGLNLYELIAKACGECWDDEDEQKTAEGASPPLWGNNKDQQKKNSAALWDVPRAKSPKNCVPSEVKKETQTCLPLGSPTSRRFTLQERRRTLPTNTGRQ